MDIISRLKKTISENNETQIVTLQYDYYTCNLIYVTSHYNCTINTEFCFNASKVLLPYRSKHQVFGKNYICIDSIISYISAFNASNFHLYKSVLFGNHHLSEFVKSFNINNVEFIGENIFSFLYREFDTVYFSTNLKGKDYNKEFKSLCKNENIKFSFNNNRNSVISINQSMFA